MASLTFSLPARMLSFCLVHRLPSWGVVNKSVNPTKSTVVDNPIAFVKKKETHGQGKESCTDRAFEHSKFKQVLDSFHQLLSSNFNCKFCYPAMIKFMFHYIACGNDATHVSTSLLKQSSKYPWTLVCTLQWSKNM